MRPRSAAHPSRSKSGRGGRYQITRHVLTAEGGITRDDRRKFGGRRRDDDLVERVPVMLRKRLDGGRVFERDGRRYGARAGERRSEIVTCVELSERSLDGDPHTTAALNSTWSAPQSSP